MGRGYGRRGQAFLMYTAEDWDVLPQRWTVTLPSSIFFHEMFESLLCGIVVSSGRISRTPVDAVWRTS